LHHTYKEKLALLVYNLLILLELSLKKEKHSTKTKTPSLVIHRVRFLRNLQKKSTLVFKGGWRGRVKLIKPSILVVN
jgi:hypothetical protein